MDSDALDRIERELDIELPESYREVMLDYPIPAFASNADTELWDDADAIIARNRELREGIGAPAPWPTHLFFIGDPLSGAANAIDLRDEAAPVWWLDYCDIESAAEGEAPPPFAQWVEDWARQAREDLAGNGVDPDAAEAATRASGCLTICLLLAAGTALAAGFGVG